LRFHFSDYAQTPSETPKNVQENLWSKNHKIALTPASIKARKASFRQFQTGKI